MDIKAVGLIIGFVIIIGGVLLMSITQEVVEDLEEDEGLQNQDETEDTADEERPYFWLGSGIVVFGLAVIALSIVKRGY